MEKWFIAFALFLSGIPLVAAESSILGGVWDKILYAGGLGFIGIESAAAVVGLVRLLVWIILFTILFAVMVGLGGSQGTAPMKYFSRGQAGIIAAAVATITAVFLPADVLLATGAGWGTLIALLLIGLPVVGIAFLLWKIPWEGEETKFTVLLKLVLSLLLLWILVAMKYHVGVIA